MLYRVKIKTQKFKQQFNDMSAIIGRKPGIIKQKNAQQNNKTNYHQEQMVKQSSISVDLSNVGLKIFPHQFDRGQAQQIGQLCLDNNCIRQCVVDLNLFRNLDELSIQENKMKKFNIKRCIGNTKIYNLKILNLSHNNLEFVDLSAITNLRDLNVSNNNLSTIILSQQNLQLLDISYNQFSNIQHSVLSSRIFAKLQNLKISNNNRSLYDLILAIDGKQLAPSLKYLDCSNNVLSYIQHLPTSLQYLDLQNNHFIFDRRAVNQIIRLHRLKQLKITGNTISNSFIDIIKTKTKYGTNSQLKLVYQQEPCVKQSPYKLYNTTQQNHVKNNTQGGITYSNFTLGDEQANNDGYSRYDGQDDIDPDYNLINVNEVQQVDQTIPCFSKGKIKQEQQYIKQQNQQRLALKNVENSLKTQKFKLKIDGVRYQNHYRLYFQKIIQFMMIPPYPIPHRHRNTNISVRIDPCPDSQTLNQFQLLNQMFKARGGIHYLRKVFNWQKTKVLKPENAKILFINAELTKQKFDQICDGNYDVIQQASTHKYLLNQQPCSFSCYHILARIDPIHPQRRWSCVYLIQAVHL